MVIWMPGLVWRVEQAKETVAWKIPRKKGRKRERKVGARERDLLPLKLQYQRNWEIDSEPKSAGTARWKQGPDTWSFRKGPLVGQNSVISLWPVAAPVEQHLAFDSSQQGMAGIHAPSEQLFTRQYGHPSFSESSVDKMLTHTPFTQQTLLKHALCLHAPEAKMKGARLPSFYTLVHSSCRKRLGFSSSKPSLATDTKPWVQNQLYG